MSVNAFINGMNTNSSSSVLIENYINKKDDVSGGGLVDSGSLREINNDLGEDAFLQILIAQMQNQDPLEPTSDTEFIAQMAQFSALEQMQALNQNFINSQSYNYIGKTVVADITYQDDGGDFVTTNLVGVVSGVKVQDNKPYLIVGDYLVDPVAVTESYNSSNLDNSILQGSSLVGKHVTANMVKENGDVKEVTGKVTKVTVVEGRVYAVVDGEYEIPVANITAIEDEPVKNDDTEVKANPEV